MISEVRKRFNKLLCLRILAYSLCANEKYNVIYEMGV